MKSSFIVNISLRDRDGRVVGTKQVIRYEGLLARAHEDGLRSIATQLIQVPSKENGDVAIVRAVVITNRGTFEGLGDASPSNVNARMAGALLRIAETRAKARSLRDAVNIGLVALDELDETDDPNDLDLVVRTTDAAVHSPANSNQSAAAPAQEARDDLMTAAQRRLLFRIAAERGVANDDIQKWLEDRCGLKSVKTWSKVDASRMIERLKAQNGHGQAASS